MRTAGWIVVGAVFVLLVSAAPAASAGSDPQHDAAVDIYVEELPTATGVVPADSTALAATELQTTASGDGATSGGDGVVGLVLVVAGTTAAIVFGRLRSRSGRDSDP